VQVYVTSTTDPLFNLATEEWIFREGDPSKQTLYLWRNAPTVHPPSLLALCAQLPHDDGAYGGQVVIGRHQNPFKECHLSVMEQENVVLARRYSGGGAVYQDLGNTNFTFLSNINTFDKAR
jgi:lipoate-protein ligase A